MCVLLLVSLETCEYIVLHVTGFTIVRVILVYRTVYLNVSVCEANGDEKYTRDDTRVENGRLPDHLQCAASLAGALQRTRATWGRDIRR